MTALLASQAGHVHSVEIIPEFKVAAQQKLTGHDFHNVTLEVGDASCGWPSHAPYDVILLTGSVPVLAEAWFAQLKPGGRLIALVGVAPAMAARRISVLEPGVQISQDLFETNVRALKNAPQPEQFVF